jgi:hypothetical protein
MVTFFFGFVAILLVVAGSLGGLVFVRKRVRIATLVKNHEVADPLLSVVGTLFAILLGFLIAGAMSKFDEARLNVNSEAGAIADLFRLAQGLPEPRRQALKTYCTDYVDTVLNEEWQLMEVKQASEKAWRQYGEIWRLCLDYEPATQGQSNVHQALLAALSELGNHRTLRLAAMQNNLPLGMWVLVVVGGLTTIAFTYFFGLESFKSQVIMTSVVATVLSLDVFLLANYDYPFSGDIRVQPRAFQLDQQLFKALNMQPELPGPAK